MGRDLTPRSNAQHVQRNHYGILSMAVTLLDHLSCTERFNLVTSNAETLVLITSTPIGTVVDWSAGAEAMFGWTQEEMTGQPLRRIFTEEDVAEGVPEKEMEQAQRDGAAPDTRWMLRKDGSKVFADGEMTSLRLPDGTLAGFVKVLRDASVILQFQQSDATLRAMVNATPHMVWSADGEGRADYFNDRMLAFTGQPVENLIGHGWNNLVHPEDRANAWKTWVEANETATALSIEFRFLHRSSEYRWVLCMGEPVFDQTTGELVRWMGTNTDIHEQKVLNVELRDARQRLDVALSAGNIGTWNLDLVTNQLYADEHMARLFGVDTHLNEGVPVDRYFAAIHPDDMPEVRQRIEQAISTCGAFSATYRVVLSQGKTRHIHARGKVAFGDNGKPLWLPGAVMDITELKASQEELRVRGERYRTLFNSIDEGFAIVELVFDEHGNAIDHRYLEANTAVSTISGWIDIAGKLSSDVNPEHAATWRETYVQVLRTGKPHQRVVEVEHWGRWVDVSIMRLGDESMHQVAVFLRDVTPRKKHEDELRRREERYRALFNAIEEGFAIIELITDESGCANDYRFLEVNPASEHITGLKDVLGKTLREVVAQPNFEWIKRYEEVARTGEPQQWTDYSQALNAWYDLSAVRVGAAAGNQVALLFKDVTERKRNDEALKQLAEDLAQANSRQREFLATLAHELRNPLAPIRNGLDVMRMVANDPEKLGKLREVMSRQVAHLTHLVDDLLDLARVTSGKIELKRSLVLLGPLVQQAVDAAAPLMQSKQHDFAWDIADQPIWLTADPTRVVQMISNILTNAAKYTSEHGVVRLHAERDGDWAVISVKDNGIGISSASLPHLFEMFSQVSAASDLSEGGLGIGLNLVKRLVEKHGGTVEAASAGEQKGAVFTLRLPISQHATDQPSPPSDHHTN